MTIVHYTKLLPGGGLSYDTYRELTRMASGVDLEVENIRLARRPPS